MLLQTMPDSKLEFLVVNLSKIEAIVEGLPRVAKRSELKAKADEILRLIEMVRRQAYTLADSKPKETDAPNFDVLWGGRPKKDRAETPRTTERRLERVKVTWERRINPWKYKGED
jgi:hypothetical protein